MGLLRPHSTRDLRLALEYVQCSTAYQSSSSSRVARLLEELLLTLCKSFPGHSSFPQDMIHATSESVFRVSAGRDLVPLHGRFGSTLARKYMIGG